MLIKVLNKIYKSYSESSRQRYVSFLRKKGIQIGNNSVFHCGIKDKNFDLTRPSLITIGNNVQFNRNFTLLTHDYVSALFINCYNDFVSSSGRVVIGNNVAFGFDCTVLKGVTIGDNCFIGAGSIVSQDIPSNSIAVGRPAKVVCPLEDYYLKRKSQCIEEAFEYARSIKERFGRMPVISDFWEEFPLFLNGDDIHTSLPIKSQLGNAFEVYKVTHKAKFDGFDDFIKKAKLK